MKLLDLKQELAACINRKQEMLNAPKAAGRQCMNEEERAEYQTAFAREGELQVQINRSASNNTLLSAFGGNPMALVDAGAPSPASNRAQRPMST